MTNSLKMADVSLDPQNENPKELYSQGVRAYVLQDYDTAVTALSKASALLSTEHNDDLHDSLGDVYLYYGKSLLELSRKESGPLGEGVLKNVEDSGSEDVEDSEGEEAPDEGEEKDKANVDSTEKMEEKEEEAQSSAADEEAAGSSEKKEGEEAEEELTDLQVAWEVLELAKTIFTKRADEGKKNLSETLIVLGEISLESGNFQSAIDDITQGLEIQKKLFSNDNRTIAETYYKLGGALSTNGQIEESISSFTSSFECLKAKLESLQKDENGNTEEIAELNSLIPEIEEKIADMKMLKTEMANKVSSTVKESDMTNGNCSSAASSSSKPATNISHLVKRKRKSDEAADVEIPAKKPSP